MASIEFPGKAVALELHKTVRPAEFTRIPELSYSSQHRADYEAPEHWIIEGDNLPVMAAMAATTATIAEPPPRFDRIYLDPPYNSGNSVRGSWVYDDTGKDSARNSHRRPSASVLNGHDQPQSRQDRWLFQLTPRLVLARELLLDTGIIFVSIAERELEFLALLMSEIFGPENRVAIMSIRSLHTVRNSSKDFSRNTEHVICYAKNLSLLVNSEDRSTYLRVPSDKLQNYPYNDQDEKGPYRLDQLYARNHAKPYIFRFSDGREWQAPDGSFPRYSQHELQRLEAAGELTWSRGEARVKRYLQRVAEGEPPSTFPAQHLSGYSKDGTAELRELFDGRRVFSQPKPLALMRYLLQIGRPCDNANQNQTILDCYGGSGTTMEAVMALNAEDNGTRRCTLIQTGAQDVGGDSSAAVGGDNGDGAATLNICRDITRERVIRASQKHAYASGFSYFRTESSFTT
ncbi:MAG: site-specific DNA-methyltransferase [Spirochaetaceae bacterium]|nr:MAG: site-specific DNA-methyltransferase [Spirochaetaceae bacterium]